MFSKTNDLVERDLVEENFKKVNIDDAAVKPSVGNSPFYGENIYMEKERFQMLNEKVKVIQGLMMLLESNIGSLNQTGREQLKVRLESIISNF